MDINNKNLHAVHTTSSQPATVPLFFTVPPSTQFESLFHLVHPHSRSLQLHFQYSRIAYIMIISTSLFRLFPSFPTKRTRNQQPRRARTHWLCFKYSCSTVCSSARLPSTSVCCVAVFCCSCCLCVCPLRVPSLLFVSSLFFIFLRVPAWSPPFIRVSDKDYSALVTFLPSRHISIDNTRI